jgi:hypothetical protein
MVLGGLKDRFQAQSRNCQGKGLTTPYHLLTTAAQAVRSCGPAPCCLLAIIIANYHRPYLTAYFALSIAPMLTTEWTEGEYTRIAAANLDHCSYLAVKRQMINGFEAIQML